MNTYKTFLALLLAICSNFMIPGGHILTAQNKNQASGHALDQYTMPKEEQESKLGKAMDRVIVEPLFKASIKALGSFLKHTPAYFFFQGMVGAPLYPYKAIQEYALYKDDANKNVKIAMIMVPEACGAILQLFIDQKIVHIIRSVILNNPGAGIQGFLINAAIGLVTHAIALYTYFKIKEKNHNKATH